jgi:phospholipase/carboxylesterase
MVRVGWSKRAWLCAGWLAAFASAGCKQGDARRARDPAAAPESSRVTVNPASGLRTWEEGTLGVPLLLLHGYGSGPDDFLPFARTIRVPGGARFFFPEAPETTMPPAGPRGGRAWWHLGLDRHLPTGSFVPDLTRVRPPGLAIAAAKVRALVGEIGARTGVGSGGVILGGFSQGAMVSAEVAFRSTTPLKALVLLSGTAVDEPSWREPMPRRRGLRVFIAHGRGDVILPFAVAERMAATMKQAGLTVTWVPFDGGHDVPTEIVVALNAFLASL